LAAGQDDTGDRSGISCAGHQSTGWACK
jgi:hypothetical protein